MGSTAQRADARRNRQRLLDAAVHAFAAADGQVSLEAVARSAGVGIGTLYRHFPTREALVEAVYRNELARLRSSADRLLAEQGPDVALRAWMDRLADYVAAKRGMAETLRAVVATGVIDSTQTRDTLCAAIRQFLDAGARAGTLRGDVEAADVLTGLTGIWLATGEPGQREQCDRLLDLLVDGLRPRTG
jgi:AcrR family transcriptional regulator